MLQGAHHRPVLCREVLRGLAVRSNSSHIDATVGAGGHSQAILASSGPSGRLLGIDADAQAVSLAREQLASFGDRVRLVHGSFSRLASIASAEGFREVDGVLFDLGLSSMQLAAPERGFSFQHNGPLDMRFDPSNPRTAQALVNDLQEGELARLLWEYGEERRSRRIARAIVEARPLRSTRQLATLVEQVVHGHSASRSVREAKSRVTRRSRIHPATRTFQALRIAVNEELSALSQVLPQALELLTPGGRLVVISFHSLEDRIVKQFFDRESRECICPPEHPVCVCDHAQRLTVMSRRPVRPSEEEATRNPRCRSARLRVAVST